MDENSQTPIESPVNPVPDGQGGWWRYALRVVALALVFLVYSLARSPIPGINESHYLCKARHFWQPDWCRGDLFLESANPHAVFYAVFGWLTTRLSLDQAALFIRMGQSLLLSLGWISLGARCTGSWARTLGSAILFLLLQATGTLSGEWMVGGAESKVWSYGFLMLAASGLLEGRLGLSGLMAGLAVSFHPVVGCWGVACAAFAVIVQRYGPWYQHDCLPSKPVDASTVTWASLVTGIILFMLAALPGLIPAVQSLQAPSAEIASEADFLQVAERLPHHLDPLTFSIRAWRDYALLLIIWGLVRSRYRPTRALLAVELAMGAALLIAIAGLVAAWGPRPIKAMSWWQVRVKILKLYPFRLCDMLIPITLVWTVIGPLIPRSAEIPSTKFRRGVLSACGLGLLAVALFVSGQDRNFQDQPPNVKADWLSACHWIRENTPQSASLYATNDNWSLRWYAERPEYFHFKDCPQDAANILEWHRRYWVIYQWKIDAFQDGRVSIDELKSLRRKTGITHLVCGRFGPLEIPPAFNSPNVKVYQLPN